MIGLRERRPSQSGHHQFPGPGSIADHDLHLGLLFFFRCKLAVKHIKCKLGYPKTMKEVYQTKGLKSLKHLLRQRKGIALSYLRMGKQCNYFPELKL